MSVDRIVGELHAALREAGRNVISFPGDATFADKLTVGQVIKGRVLRHFDGGRYLVNFYGEEKVVDSAVPLRTGELIQGKVIALGERIEVRRLANGPGEPGAGAVREQAGYLLGRHERMVDEMFQRYLARLQPTERDALVAAVKNAPEPGSMTLAGLAINKLGLTMAPELLEAVFRAVVNKDKGSLFPAGVSEQDVLRQVKTADGLSAAIAELMADVPEREYFRQPDQDDAASHADAQQNRELPLPGRQGDSAQYGTGGYHLSRWIMNGQSGGALSHRVSTLPIYFGGRVVEVDIAVFDQREAKNKGDGRFRQFLFALDLDTLGKVEVAARIVGQNLRVRVSSASADATEWLSRNMRALRDGLEQAGWRVDELAYETRDGAEPGQVARTVVDHIISTDSLSRLM